MAKNRTSEVDMTSGNLFGKLFLVSIPLVFQGLLQLLYNAADLIVCGTFGSGHAVGAISATGALTNLIINLFFGLSVGSNVLMAKTYGQQDKEKAKRIVDTSIIFAIFFGILVGLFGFFLSKYFLVWMGTTEDVIDLSTIYLKIYFTGLPASMLFNFGAALLRATGDTKHPFYYLTFSGIINVLLNLLFVIVFKLDVAGVAIATVISQYISAILIFISLLRSKGFFTLKLKGMRLYRKEALEIIRIGLPAGMQGVIFSLSNVIIQSSVNSLGTNVMDGNGASSSLEGFIYTAMNAVATTSVAFVSANVGARKLYNIKKIVLYAFSLIFLINVVICGLIYLFQDQLLSLYISHDEAIVAAKQRLFIFLISYFTCGFMDTLAQGMRGLGYSLTPTIVTLIGVCAVRIIWIFTIFRTGIMHNIEGIIISYPISWILTAIVHAIMFTFVYKKEVRKEKMELLYE